MAGRKVYATVNAAGFDNNRLVGDQLVGFAIEDSMDGLARWAIKVETQSATQFDAFAKNDETPFTFRCGTDYRTASGSQTDLKRLRLLWSKRKLVGNSKTQFTFKGTCEGIAIKHGRERDKHWRELKVSDIARELIQSAGLEPVVPETDGKFSLMGGNRPTAEFLRGTLLPLAHSPKGADWRIWSENGFKLHFSYSDPQGEPLKITNISRTGWVSLTVTEIVKDTRHIDRNRSGKIEVVMFDADANRLIRREIDENTGGFNYNGDGRPNVRKKTTETVVASMNRGRQTDLTPDALVRQVGRTLWAQRGRSLYRLVGLTEFEPGITVNRPATVNLTGPLGTPDVNAGTWLVSGVRHVFSKGTVKTRVVLEKRWEK